MSGVLTILLIYSIYNLRIGSRTSYYSVDFSSSTGTLNQLLSRLLVSRLSSFPVKRCFYIHYYYHCKFYQTKYQNEGSKTMVLFYCPIPSSFSLSSRSRVDLSVPSDKKHPQRPRVCQGQNQSGNPVPHRKQWQIRQSVTTVVCLDFFHPYFVRKDRTPSIKRTLPPL